MARIYEIKKEYGLFVPTVRSDDERWIRRLCKHKHHSEREAQKCLTKALPSYMKRMRKNGGTKE